MRDAKESQTPVTRGTSDVDGSTDQVLLRTVDQKVVLSMDSDAVPVATSGRLLLEREQTARTGTI
jgi:hypothetical protein